MPSRALTLCKPCLNKKYSLRKQLLLSFLTLAAATLLLVLAAAIGTTIHIGSKAESEARDSREEQIKRHLRDATIEAAATIGERFRKLQYGILDVTAFALRDAREEDFVLDNGKYGYPVSPVLPDLRDIEITNSEEFNKSRSVWYYADSYSSDVEVPPDELSKIAQTARLDLSWPTMYRNSIDTKAIFLGIDFSASSEVFRYFPGINLSADGGTPFACQARNGSVAPCFRPTKRDWYKIAANATDHKVGRDEDSLLGDAIITAPYPDAVGSDDEWVVTIARAVYSRNSSLVEPPLLGVVGVDMRLKQVRESVENITFLEDGYSTLVTAEEGIVLASKKWDSTATLNITSICCVIDGLCPDGLLCPDVDDKKANWTRLEEVWGAQEELMKGEIRSITDDSSGESKVSIVVAAPVQTTFDHSASGGEGRVTHYLLSVVPEDEIFEPAADVANRIREKRNQIVVTTAIVAACTLVAVALSVYYLSGSITRPIIKMTEAARSIAKDGAKTNVFGGVAAAWEGIPESGSGTAGSSVDSRIHGRRTLNCTRALDCILCRGDDEISALAREFSLMITGLGKRGSAAEAKGLSEISAYPKNPFTTEIFRLPPTSPSAPTATTERGTARGGSRRASYSSTAPTERS
ncbi:unnamed protein product [Scytosiphon promiscuus]